MAVDEDIPPNPLLEDQLLSLSAVKKILQQNSAEGDGSTGRFQDRVESCRQRD